MIINSERFKKIVEKVENTGYKHLSLFPWRFHNPYVSVLLELNYVA